MIINVDTALAIAAGIAGYVVLFNVITATLGVLFSIGIERIQFGSFPSVRLLRIGATEVRVSPLLFGGHVKFAEKATGEPYAPWPVRALIAILGPIVAICVCALALGPQGLSEALLSWPQLWTAVVDFSTPVNADAALAGWFQSGGFLAAVAVVAIKCAMFNLLPLPILNGGAFLTAIVEGISGKNSNRQLSQDVLLLSLAILIAVAALLSWRVFFGG